MPKSEIDKITELTAARAILQSKASKQAAEQLVKELAWKKNHRKGETMPDFSDHRTKDEKLTSKLRRSKLARLTGLGKSEARQVIEQKIKHFEQTGNTRKLAIYTAKLQDHKNVFEQLKDKVSQ